MNFEHDSELKDDTSSSDKNNANEKETSERLSSDQPTGQSGPIPPDAHEDEAQYPSLLVLVPLTFALMISIFMIALDTNIIGTAIPKIVTQFHSLNDVGWYGSAYLLTLMSFQPTYGRFYTHFNIKWLFISALAIFEVGSTICATATSSKLLITGRAISGMGASGIFSGGLTISHGLVRPKIRPLYISIVTSVYGIAAIAGPLLGGVFTDSERLTWRFCFFLNLPFGGLAILIVALQYKVPPRPQPELSIRQKLKHMDFLGAVLLLGAMTCLLLALKDGGINSPWSNSKNWGCLLGFGIMIFCFLTVEFKLKDGQVLAKSSVHHNYMMLTHCTRAMIPFRIASQRTVAASCLFTVFVNMAIDTHIYYLPIYFQAVRGTTAEQSGIRMLPYLGSNILATIVSGASVSRFGYYVPFMWMCGIIFTAGCGVLHTLGRFSTTAQWAGYEVLTGFGFGIGFQVPYTAVQIVLPTEDVPIGNSLPVFSQALGGALAISIAQNILTNTLSQELKMIPGLDSSEIIALGAKNLTSTVPSEYLDGVLDAYTYALSRTLILPIAAAGMAFVCSLGMEWRKVEKK
ncbi:Aspyridones efflux protein [Botrytis cinerea]